MDKTPMQSWNFSSPSPSVLKDHEVNQQGSHLQGKRIALLITGSIAAYRMPDLIRELRREGADVTVFITREGLKYVTKETLEWTSLHPVIDAFTPAAEHLSDSAPFDAYLLAPATYSVINKMASGIADSVLTSTLASALGRLEQQKIPLLIAPTMHGTMHNSLLKNSLIRLHESGVTIIPPRQENGKDNLPAIEILVASTIRATKPHPFKGKTILVTGGPTPVCIDHIRRITNHFTGALAIHIAKEAWFRGAQVQLILGQGSLAAPSYLDATVIRTYDEYQSRVLDYLQKEKVAIGIFSAAVADYQPETPFAGKLPSGQTQFSLNLVPTQKVIKNVRAQFPDLYMATFKYEENLSHADLMKIAQSRLDSGYNLVVANRGEEKGPQGEQVAWIIDGQAEPERAIGKAEIACCLLDHIAQNALI
ncbi:bifunctional phosphopantothenoylcysteine decarboxylase/phosphopantothenate--cysteine ligase CoaBC [Deltaproteobacteria bacterium TL4]